MVIRRSPRNLPGVDAMFIQRNLAALFLAMAVLILAGTMLTAAEVGTRWGHLPWPIAQWALTTPLGALAVAIVSGLVCGFPLSLIALMGPLVARPVDVTDLPVLAWPLPLPLTRGPHGGTAADVWLGHGRVQRVRNLFALAFAAPLLIGLLAVCVASTWYGITQFPDCSASGCPPSFSGEFTSVSLVIGMACLYVSLSARIAYVERRCGIRFRARKVYESGFNAYVRRPGVSSEAAVAALQRYTRSTRPPIAQVIFVFALILIPSTLVFSGGEILSTWLSIHWIPA